MKFSLVLCSLGITDGPKSAGQLITIGLQAIDWGSIANWLWNAIIWLAFGQWM